LILFNVLIHKFNNTLQQMITWKETNDYLLGISNSEKYAVPKTLKIAAFDLDDTIIRLQRGKKKNDGWEFIDANVQQSIHDLVEKKYMIIIFTNQAGMTVSKNFDINAWKKKIDEIAIALFSASKKYYFAIMAAKCYDIYRKPNIGMWNVITKMLRGEISEKSFYCGDAAGRLEKDIYGKKGDFADTDRKFAINIGLSFYTPEDVFIRNFETANDKYKLSGINPKKFLKSVCDPDEEYEFKPRKKELILVVGFPGSGKSEFVKNHIVPNGYEYVNRDTCKTKAKCLKLTRDALEKNKSVVIDNTNVDYNSRMAYVALGLEFQYKHIRCILIDIDFDLAKHLNNTRHVYSDGEIPLVSDIAYNIMKKKFEVPTKGECFDKIETVKFCFDSEKLEDKKWKKAFMQLS